MYRGWSLSVPYIRGKVDTRDCLWRDCILLIRVTVLKLATIHLEGTCEIVLNEWERKEQNFSYIQS